MKIRSITCFGHPQDFDKKNFLYKLKTLIDDARNKFEQKGFEVQSTRLATVPFFEFLPAEQQTLWPKLAREFEEQIHQSGFDYLSLGSTPVEQPELIHQIPLMLSTTKDCFFGMTIADKKCGISLPAIHAAAQTICDASKLEKDGFGNRRLAALANVPPFTPFFPAAYSQGAKPAFSIALQTADDFLNIISRAKSLQQARHDLLSYLNHKAEQMAEVASILSKEFAVDFKGFDFSTAPYPQDWCSIGKAFESMGTPTAGSAGTLAAAAFIADVLQQGEWQKAGFNGMMLPVLEDNILAARTAENQMGIYDLLMYSAVCGTGLDTLPLPGDITPQEIAPLLLDVAALSLRLDKPLTARLMPIPGKKAGDLIKFESEFFADGRVLTYRNQPLSGLWLGNESFHLKSYGN